MTERRRPVAPAVALAVVLALAALAVALFAGGSGTGRVLVARSDLDAGESLRSALADARAEWVAADLPVGVGGVVEPADLDPDAHLSGAVPRGEIIVRAQLERYRDEVSVGEGERLISVPLGAAGAIGRALAVDARVDLLATVVEGPAAAARVVAANAPVVRIVADDASAARGGDGIVLRVATDEALAVTEALSGGAELRLVARSADGRAAR